jgi:hypothetical protein
MEVEKAEVTLVWKDNDPSKNLFNMSWHNGETKFLEYYPASGVNLIPDSTCTITNYALEFAKDEVVAFAYYDDDFDRRNFRMGQFTTTDGVIVSWKIPRVGVLVQDYYS